MPSKESCITSLPYVMDTLYVLGGKWKLPVILSIMHGAKRFNEIQQEVNGISPKVLAQELKHLGLNEFITREVYSTTPVTIVYKATAYSRSLKPLLHELSTWGYAHRKRIKESMKK